MPQYIRYVQENPTEADRLFQELLIRVSSFFRDPEAFERLREVVIPRLFAGEPLRLVLARCLRGQARVEAEPAGHGIVLGQGPQEGGVDPVGQDGQLALGDPLGPEVRGEAIADDDDFVGQAVDPSLQRLGEADQGRGQPGDRPGDEYRLHAPAPGGRPRP